LRTDPNSFLPRSILLRLGDVLTLWREALWLQSHISFGTHPTENDPAPAFHPYRDITLATVGGLVSTVTVLIVSVFWILTAWPNGTTAVTFAGIMCAIMGAKDNPAAAAATFLKMSVVGAAVAGLYLFVVLPPLSTFPALVIALAPFYLACGLLMTAPSTAPFAMPMIFVAGGLIGLSNAMSYDFTVFINGAMGYVVGIGIGALALSLLRPIGTDWTVRRLIRGLIRDLAHLADGTATASRAAFESRMFDRINALSMRLDPMIADQRAVLQAGLAGLRIGLNILALRRLRLTLGADAAAVVQQALDALAAYFGRQEGEVETAALRKVHWQMLAFEDDPNLIRAAEALYNIEATLQLHSDVLGLGEDRAAVSIGDPVNA
jgi:uncharacterized membrane protein YccC